MTRAELRDWRVRAMGGETVPADVVLELIEDVLEMLPWGDNATTYRKRSRDTRPGMGPPRRL